MELESGESLPIGKHNYKVSPHPNATGNIPYSQEGRKSIVYQVRSEPGGQFHALKIFKKAHRGKYIVSISDRLKHFSQLPGMGASERTVLTARKQPKLIRANPDVEYAVLMPWIKGNTWFEMLLQHQLLSPEQSFWCARRLAFILTTLESRSIAHCDLSGANLVIDLEASQIQLIDLEDLYAVELTPPPRIPAGTLGYQHRTSRDGQWNRFADRFAAAILLSEILCGHLEAFQRQCWGESYFAPDELQDPLSERYLLMDHTLQSISPRLSKLLQQAWTSTLLEDCPPVSSWFEALDLMEAFHPGSRLKQDAPYVFGASAGRLPSDHQPWTEHSLLQDWDPSGSIEPFDIAMPNGEEPPVSGEDLPAEKGSHSTS